MAELARPFWWMLVLALAGGIYWWSGQPPRSMRMPDGVQAAEPPRQTERALATPLAHGSYRLTPLADFELRARVLSVLWYRHDRESDLAPIDFALGWGPMSDNRLLDQLSFDHSGRYFLWRWPAEPPADPDLITRSATNIHLIPANAGIEAQLRRIGAGRVVRLRGVLVEAQSPDGWRWRSSLSRSDSGGGACELLLVQAVLAE